MTIELIPAGLFQTELRAFHGDSAIKEKYLARVRAHALADEIVQGETWRHGKGCAVGCTLHQYSHEAYETELGVPGIIARLEDGIFEGLANDIAKSFPLAFLEAIPVGADLSHVWPTFAVWLLADPAYGVRQYAKSDRSRDAIDRVVDLYRSGSTDAQQYRAAYAYAYDYDYAAAAAAAYAAYAAYAADAAADYAAADYAAAAAADGGRSKREYRIAQRDMLLQLLANAPVPVVQS